MLNLKKEAQVAASLCHLKSNYVYKTPSVLIECSIQSTSPLKLFILVTAEVKLCGLVMLGMFFADYLLIFVTAILGDRGKNWKSGSFEFPFPFFNLLK